MAQQNLTIGAQNGGGGNNYFEAFTKVEANTTELYAKTVANAAAIIANTNLITGFTKTYWFYAADAATASSPIVHGAGATNTFLTNDALGARTTSYNPNSNNALWNPSTNKFVFTSLKIGDVVEIRIDLLIDHGAAQEFNILMSIGETTAAPYETNVNHDYYKTASTGISLTALFRLPIADAYDRDGGARFRVASIAAASIVVEGWFYQITEV
jgi:hypothetical protein